MGDPQVEGLAAHFPGHILAGVVAKIMPKAERKRGQTEPAPPGATILHLVVAAIVRGVGHLGSSSRAKLPTIRCHCTTIRSQREPRRTL